MWCRAHGQRYGINYLDSKARRAIDCGSPSLLPGFIPSRSLSFYIFVKPSVTCAACPWFILARHKQHKPQSRGSVTLYMVCLLDVRLCHKTQTVHKPQAKPIQRYDAHALSMLFSVVQNWPAFLCWLPSALTDNKQKSGANQQASSYVIV